MKPPLPMRLRPLWLRQRIFWRLYRARAQRWPGLFADRELAFAPAARMDLHPSDGGHRQIALAGFYELRLSRALAGLAAAGGLLIDVGANYGYYSLIWCSARPDNRALAFEASPRVHPALVANVAKNRLDAAIACRRIAVGREPGRMAFTVGPPEETGWGGLAREAAEGTVEVEVTTLDDVLEREHPAAAVAALKIDIEGADAWALEGAARALAARRIRHVFYEENLVRMELLGIAPGTAERLLRAHGYRVERLDRHEWHGWAS
jgi:FkbM family methyltransferase